MPSVIKLTKSDLIEFAQVVVLANTPLSLFNGMVRCAGMAKLRKCPTTDLTVYYDHVTARAERSEVVIGLAYAILCAVVLQKRESPEIRVDSSRLQWGERIWDFMKRASIGTGLVAYDAAPQRPRVSTSGTNSTDTPMLYGPGGNVVWRND
jgi:hypothetical protein